MALPVCSMSYALRYDSKIRLLSVGGGVGLAMNAPFRIATENTVFAMPETKIGYCPDVGASYFLSRVDGEIGTYMGLTSEILKGRAVLWVICSEYIE